MKSFSLKKYSFLKSDYDCFYFRHHRRMKSNGVKVDGVDNEQEQFEFHIVSLDNKKG